ncbi:hypothetical protein A8M32_25810 [Sinorhizobium alkalisoli]|uniref:Uncharacterized protein n=1 Tax=Sinorhizobium alkalisoli TaxID=1752398 RepID=A0A1E3V4G8_9HYPH|nr:hypothetical protein A8M32_25810 [Sinorhizobium alkalisoli]
MHVLSADLDARRPQRLFHLPDRRERRNDKALDADVVFRVGGSETSTKASASAKALCIFQLVPTHSPDLLMTGPPLSDWQIYAATEAG